MKNSGSGVGQKTKEDDSCYGSAIDVKVNGGITESVKCSGFHAAFSSY